MASKALSFGWIMQPALFSTPGGMDSRDIRLARDMIAANEQQSKRQGKAGSIPFGWKTICAGEKAHLECFTNMAWLAGRHADLQYGTMVCGQGFRNARRSSRKWRRICTCSPRVSSSLGVGAGNNAAEHYEYGFNFASNAERLAQTEEAIE